MPLELTPEITPFTLDMSKIDKNIIKTLDKTNIKRSNHYFPPGIKISIISMGIIQGYEMAALLESGTDLPSTLLTALEIERCLVKLSNNNTNLSDACDCFLECVKNALSGGGIDPIRLTPHEMDAIMFELQQHTDWIEFCGWNKKQKLGAKEQFLVLSHYFNTKNLKLLSKHLKNANGFKCFNKNINTFLARPLFYGDSVVIDFLIQENILPVPVLLAKIKECRLSLGWKEVTQNLLSFEQKYTLESDICMGGNSKDKKQNKI